MYPNNNQKQQPLPTDYLNQIAPKAPPKLNFLRSRPIFFSLIGIIVIVIIFIIIGSVSNNANSNQQLAARLQATEDITDQATSNIKSSQLRALNSQLKLYLTNTIRDITPILSKENININKLDKSVTTAESDTAILNRLEDARLNAKYDTVYANEMAYQLSNTLTLMRQIYNNTKNSQLKTFLEDAYKNLTPTQKQFADFNSTTT